jgi:1,4-dihydroxy-2-naphthoyl-CoA synthase
MESTDILYEKHDGIAIATFNRPEILNAFRKAHELRNEVEEW